MRDTTEVTKEQFRASAKRALDRAARDIGLELNEFYVSDGYDVSSSNGQLMAAHRLSRAGGRRRVRPAYSVLFESTDPFLTAARFPELSSHYDVGDPMSFELWVTYYPLSKEVVASIDRINIPEEVRKLEPSLADKIQQTELPIDARLHALAAALSTLSRRGVN